MPEKHLNEISNTEWIITTIVAVWASVVTFIQDQKDNKVSCVACMLIKDFIISGGSTYLVFLAAVGYGINNSLAIALSGYIGHKTVIFSKMIENFIQRKLNEYR